MQIMVELNKELYKALQKGYILIGGMRGGKTLLNGLLSAIANGTPLPQNHGRLKDVDWIDDNCPNYYTDDDGSWCYKWKDIDNAPTIIEASEVEVHDE